MSAISGWILSIAGLSIIAGVAELILPSERMGKYIKSVLSATVALVIILPLPDLLKNGCNADFKAGDEVNLQQSYIEYVNSFKAEYFKKGFKSALKDSGIILGEFEISGDFSSSSPVIDKVEINLSQVVIDGNYEHINKYNLVLNKVTEYLGIEKEAVFIYERE